MRILSRDRWQLAHQLGATRLTGHRGAARAGFTVLLPLFVDGEHVVARTELGAELQGLAPAFVSRATGRAFLGYLDAQRRGLTGERHATRTRELSRAHGYDTKYAMHALRIAHQGLELLTTGRITLPVPEPARTRLRAVRSGAVPLDEVLERLGGAKRAARARLRGRRPARALRRRGGRRVPRERLPPGVGGRAHRVIGATRPRPPGRSPARTS
jgi:hypothetical protein